MAFLLAPFRSAWQHRKLLRALSAREITTSFKGSFVGLGWLLLQPLASLAIYALVFGGIFNAGGDNRMLFVSQLFIGIIIVTAFSEPAGRAPSLVVSRPNYVTKIVFPLDLLPWPVVSLAAVQAMTSTLLLLVLHTVFVGAPDWTVIALPVVVAPVLLLGLAASWVLSSLGVYVRDTGEVVRVVIQMLFFLSPVVWTTGSLAKQPVLLQILMLNPLAVAMETARSLVDNSHPSPSTTAVVALFAGSIVLAALAHAFFRRTKDGFVDVL